MLLFHLCDVYSNVAFDIMRLLCAATVSSIAW